MNGSTDRAERFTRAYEAAYADLLRFVQRRVPPGTEEDVVAEAMTVAWRRADELPHSLDDARAWLFGIARYCLFNHSRSAGRKDALAVRIATVSPGDRRLAPDAAEAAVARVDLARAWAELSPTDQETLALTVLDGLDSHHAGQVVGISAAAYRLRLSRARAALRRRLEGAASHAGATPNQEVLS